MLRHQQIDFLNPVIKLTTPSVKTVSLVTSNLATTGILQNYVLSDSASITRCPTPLPLRVVRLGFQRFGGLDLRETGLQQIF